VFAFGVSGEIEDGGILIAPLCFGLHWVGRALPSFESDSRSLLIPSLG